MYKDINKIIPLDINGFDEMPETSIYYKTLQKKEFLIVKNNRVIILQSPDIAKIQIKYSIKVLFH